MRFFIVLFVVLLCHVVGDSKDVYIYLNDADLSVILNDMPPQIFKKRDFEYVAENFEFLSSSPQKITVRFLASIVYRKFGKTFSLLKSHAIADINIIQKDHELCIEVAIIEISKQLQQYPGFYDWLLKKITSLFDRVLLQTSTENKMLGANIKLYLGKSPYEVSCSYIHPPLQTILQNLPFQKYLKNSSHIINYDEISKSFRIHGEIEYSGGKITLENAILEFPSIKVKDNYLEMNSTLHFKRLIIKEDGDENTFLNSKIFVHIPIVWQQNNNEIFFTLKEQRVIKFFSSDNIFLKILSNAINLNYHENIADFISGLKIPKEHLKLQIKVQDKAMCFYLQQILVNANLLFFLYSTNTK